MTKVAITKAAAAQRQIDSAIRMVFLHREDLLAVQTVAAAARTVVKDLAKKRGIDLTQETREALKAMYHGRSNVPDAELDKFLDEKTLRVETDRRTHSFRNRSANFLKHADQDGTASIEAEEIDALWVIADAINVYSKLDLNPTHEMLFYMRWFSALNTTNEHNRIVTKSGPIHSFTFTQQIDFGEWLLEQILRDSGRSTTHFRDDDDSGAGDAMLPRMFTALD